MVITALEEKENKKFYVPIRGGNRGGWDRFKWENVMYLPYKERELYLGNSAMIGFLDKGGKWRKKNWYLKTEKDFKSLNPKEEMLEAKRKDEQRLRAALGDDAFEESQGEQLAPAELQELKRKIKQTDEGGTTGGAAGLGFDKLKVEIRSRPAIDSSNPYRLEGSFEEPPDITNKEDRSHRKKKKRERSFDNTVKVEHNQEKQDERRQLVEKSRKKEKKQKKEKKSKKDKDRRHDRRRYSRSSENRSTSKDRHHKRHDSRKRDDSRSRSRDERRRERHHRKRSPSREYSEERRRSRSPRHERKHAHRRYQRSQSRDRKRSSS